MYNYFKTGCHIYIEGEKMIRRLVSAALAAVLAAVTAAAYACGSGSEKPEAAGGTQAPSQAASPSEEETTEAKLLPDLPDDLDFGGATAVIMQHPFQSGDWADWVSRDIWSDGENGEPINDAVYARNLAVEEKLNIKIKAEDVNDMPSTIQKQVKSGSSDYLISTARIQSLPGTVTKGYLVNLYDMPYMDLAKPWYDERCIEDASYYGLLYYVTGDMVLLDDDSTGAMVFNKQLIGDFGLDMPYDLVYGGKWTFDKMADMAKAVASDLNGNGEVDIEQDRFGILWQRDAIVSLMHGGEARIVSKNGDGEPVYTITDRRAVDVFDKIDSIFFEPTVVQNMHNYSSIYPDIYFGEANIFRANNALFMWIRMRVAQNLRDMEADFGIIPDPKYDEAQKDYYSTVTKYTAATVCIPNSAIDRDMAGAVVEAMSAEGHYGMREAYYENNLGSKVARDAQSTEMLDLIFSNRIYDAGEIYNLGSISDSLYSLSTGKTGIGLSALIAKNESKMEKQLEKNFTAPLKELADAAG